MLKKLKEAPWTGYIALFLILASLTGVFRDSPTILKAIDYQNMLGQFGTLAESNEIAGVSVAGNFQGTGGYGVRDGFLLAFSIAPAIILVYGMINVYEDLQGPKAAEVIFNPILRPLMGLPGAAALPVISALTSGDASIGVARELYLDGILSKNQQLLLTTFIFSAPAILVNLPIFVSPVESYLTVSVSVILVVIIVMKFVGVNILRFFIRLRKRGVKNDQ